MAIQQLHLHDQPTIHLIYFLLNFYFIIYKMYILLFSLCSQHNIPAQIYKLTLKGFFPSPLFFPSNFSQPNSSHHIKYKWIKLGSPRLASRKQRLQFTESWLLHLLWENRCFVWKLSLWTIPSSDVDLALTLINGIATVLRSTATFIIQIPSFR